MAMELTKKEIAELSAIVQQNVEAELQGDKLKRMQSFGKEDGTIDTNGVLASLFRTCRVLCYLPSSESMSLRWNFCYLTFIPAPDAMMRLTSRFRTCRRFIYRPSQFIFMA